MVHQSLLIIVDKGLLCRNKVGVWKIAYFFVHSRDQEVNEQPVQYWVNQADQIQAFDDFIKVFRNLLLTTICFGQVNCLVDEKDRHAKSEERAQGHKPNWKPLIVRQAILPHSEQHDYCYCLANQVAAIACCLYTVLIAFVDENCREVQYSKDKKQDKVH